MSPDVLRLFILVVVFAAVLLFSERAIAYWRSRSGDSSAINKRLKLISKGVSRDNVLAALRRSSSEYGSLPGPVARMLHRVEEAISGAGLPFSPLQVLGVFAVFTLILFVIVLGGIAYFGNLINFGKILLAASFALALGLVVPLMVLFRLADRRRKRLIEQFPIALDVFVRGLRAGHPVASALELLTTEMSDPIGSEFGVVGDEVTYGADLRDALQDMADRCGIDDMQMFVVSLSIQAETGGNLAEILDNLSDVIRERASMMMKVRALSSEGRMTAVILTALPVVSFVVLFASNPAFYLDVAEDPYFIPGFLALLVGFAIGIVWIRKLIDLKV